MTLSPASDHGSICVPRAPYPYGCAVLVEAEVRPAALEREETIWHLGPAPMRGGHRLKEDERKEPRLQPETGASPNGEENEAAAPVELHTRAIREEDKRMALLGTGITNLTYNQPFAPPVRYHTPLFRTYVGRKWDHTAIDKLELLAADLLLPTHTAFPRPPATGASEWVPAVVIVHIRPWDLPDDDGDGLAFPVLREHEDNDRLTRLQKSFDTQNRVAFLEKLEKLLTSSEQTPAIKLVGATSTDRMSRIPLYTVLTDVMGFDDIPVELLRKVRRTDAEAHIKPRPHAQAMARARESYALSLATLGHSYGRHPDDSPTTCAEPITTSGWTFAFSDYGAGLVYHGRDHDDSFSTRAYLSGSWMDLLALELLQHSVLGWFTSRASWAAAAHTASSPGDHASSETAPGLSGSDIWRAYITFMASYDPPALAKQQAHRLMMEGFEKQLAEHSARLLERTQPVLEHLDALDRLEQETLTRKAQEKEAKEEKEFNHWVGLIATLFVPIAILPDLLSWLPEWPGIKLIRFVLWCIGAFIFLRWGERILGGLMRLRKVASARASEESNELRCRAMPQDDPAPDPPTVEPLTEA